MTYFDKWIIERNELNNGLYGPMRIISTCYVGLDARRTIATINVVNPRSTENARLIASAPQLLAAANDALAVLLSLQAENPGRNADVDHIIRMLIAAIATAKESEK